MTPKEAFSNIVTYDINDSGRTVGDYCEEECNIVGKALTRLEELEKEVAIAKKLLPKYQFLNENTNDYDLNCDEVDVIHNEIYELELKLDWSDEK